MKINNIINSPTNSLGWTAFTTTITATTTAPTFGAGTVMKSYYLQHGKILSVTLSLQAAVSGASDGNGVYLFSIPPGFSIDTSIVSFNNTNFNLGNAFAFSSVYNAYGSGSPVAYDSTRYTAIMPSTNPFQLNYISSVWFQATSGSVYGINLKIPIV